jgi:hypothetical protein
VFLTTIISKKNSYDTFGKVSSSKAPESSGCPRKIFFSPVRTLRRESSKVDVKAIRKGRGGKKKPTTHCARRVCGDEFWRCEISLGAPYCQDQAWISKGEL